MNSGLKAKDGIVLQKQSHQPPLHSRCPLLDPKETLLVGFSLNTHMLGLFSQWKCCIAAPSETLCGSAGKGCKSFVKARGERAQSSSPAFRVMHPSLRTRNQRMGVKQGYWTGLQTSLKFRISMLTWNHQIKFCAIESLLSALWNSLSFKAGREEKSIVYV